MPDSITSKAPAIIFDYFATEILGKIDPRTRKFLITSSLLSEISAATAELYHTAQEWDGLVKLILSQAPVLFFQGRQHTLRVWLNYLPAEFVQNDPWTLFWQAVGQMSLNPLKSRKCCELAFEKFIHISDYFDQVLSFATVRGIVFNPAGQYAGTRPLDW